MKPGAAPVDLILEWSPKGIVAYDARLKRVLTFGNAADAAGNLGGREALVAVSRKAFFLRAVRVPNAQLEDVQAVLRIMIADLFPLPAQDLSYDFELTDDVNEEGRLAIVSAMPSIELRKLHSDIGGAGFRVRGVVPASLGSGVLAQGLHRPNAAVVQDSADGVAIDIVQHGRVVYTRVVGSGGRLEAEICRTHQVAGIPCGDILAARGLEIADADASTAESSLEALLGAWPERVRLNLELPEALASRKQKHIRQRRRVAGLLAITTLMLMGYVASEYLDASAGVARQKERLATQLALMKSAQSKAEADLKSRVALGAKLDTAFKPAQTLTDVLTLISNRSPAGVWLTGVTVERGKPLMIRGTARSSEEVATFLGRLNAEPRLRDGRLVFSTNALIDVTPVVQFSLTAFPVGNLPLLESAKGGQK